MLVKYFAITITLLSLVFGVSYSQGYLHAEGDRIVNGKGENFIIRSIGTGNWMIQEGYMMRTSGVAGTQHEFRQKLVQSVGEARTSQFYEAWLNNHFTRTDVDSMASWGFNAVRPALHYKWFTLPIEEEPVVGAQTWLETGFRLTDSLVKWCSENEMYVIFDMHGAPGGQGANADISDYDKTKPSLWESEANKTKLVALWYKLAERYSDEPWVGGYDLINETNWNFPEGNNSQLRDIYRRITDTIRLVDQNHIIFIEGNWFANDFSGLTPPWDDNLVYSFHKYWTYNGPGSLDYATWIRDQYNVPLWLGESGENSNTWFTNLIARCEAEQIGWSWWPVKKAGLNNILRVNVNSDYTRLIESWKGNTTTPNADEAFDAVMQFAENHRFENCVIQHDVIDAMIRQPHTTALKPYRKLLVTDHIFASDYALGRNGYAYYDLDSANYHGSTDEFTQWNKGGAYRNDGVDIQRCSDSDTTNGYNVGWIEDGEWMTYLISNDTEKLTDVNFRCSSGATGGYVQLEANGEIISGMVYIPPTGGWENWRTTTVNDILLPAGEVRLKVKFLKGGINFNYLLFTNFRESSAAAFHTLFAEISGIQNVVTLYLNKSATTTNVSVEEFELFINNTKANISGVLMEKAANKIIISLPVPVFPTDELTVSYSGTGILCGDEELPSFTKMKVENNMVPFQVLPGVIQAEEFYSNEGMELEDCLDEGGGLNTGYANQGDYLDYVIYVPKPGIYQVNNRVALNNGNATVQFSNDHDGGFQNGKTVTLMQTGGWQEWQTQPTSIYLPEGKYRLRLTAITGEFNLNWMEFSLLSSSRSERDQQRYRVYPNPADSYVQIDQLRSTTIDGSVQLFNTFGSEICRVPILSGTCRIDTDGYTPGVYLLLINDSFNYASYKLLIN